MKQWYTIIISAVILCSVSVPLRTSAQCACPNGDPVDSVVQTKSRGGILPFNTPLIFSQFDPSVGLLSCIRFSGRVNTILNMDLVNRDSTARVIYEMNYTRVTSFTAPGISVSASENRVYGPFDLGQASVDPDTAVQIGPDTIFHDRFLITQTSNVVPYIGSGDISINYYNNGSYLMTQGNDNFRLIVAANSTVVGRLIYYWCPNIVLSNSIERFSVLRNENTINLQWYTSNDGDAKTYKVEYSTDGKNFSAVNEQAAKGTAANYYNFSFQPPSSSGELYFRIRQVDSKGKSKYSVVKALSYKENAVMNTIVFPNPAMQDLTINFASPQTGHLDIQLVNTAGQVLEQHAMQSAKATTLKLSLSKRQKQGVYWLRVRNRQTGEQTVTRLSLQ